MLNLKTKFDRQTLRNAFRTSAGRYLLMKTGGWRRMIWRSGLVAQPE